MNSTTTLERPADAPDSQKPSSTAPSHRTRNNVLGVIAAIIFFGMCIAIAFGAGNAESVTPFSTDRPEASVPVQPLIDDTVADEAAEPVVDESVVVTPVADEPAAVAPVADELVEEEPLEEAPEPVPAEPVEEARAAVTAPNSPPAPPGAPEDYSILSGGKLYLRGVVPSTLIESQVVQAVALVMGPENVFSEYSIDPSKVIVEGAATPVFVDDTIVFESGSAEITPDFVPLLAISPVLLAVQPDVVVTITGHTDNVGSDQANLELSQARVDAARDWIIAAGGDADRIIAIGEGASRPIADNDTLEGRQANRRVEFIVEGFSFS